MPRDAERVAPLALTRRDLLAAAAALVPLQPTPASAATPLRRDPAGRPVVDTWLDGRGPFRFLLDTGAALSAVSEFLAGELRGIPTTAATSTVRGSTGDTSLRSLRFQELRVDRLRVAAPVLAVLQATPRGEDAVDGVLGADLLLAAGARLQFAFRAASATLVGGPDEHDAIDRGEIDRGLGAVEIVRRDGPLWAIRGRFSVPPASHATRPDAPPRRPGFARGEVEVAALLDTGAQRSIGNLALQRALRLEAIAPQAAPAAAVVRGAGGQALAAQQLDTPPLRLGTATLPAAPMLYADLPVFAYWGLSQRPALLLGMDLLGRLSQLSLDYRRGRVALARDAAPP